MYSGEMGDFRVAAFQFSASRIKEENLKKILNAIKLASKAKVDLIVFPEYSMFYPLPRGEFTRLAEHLDGEFTRSVAEAAKKFNVNVVLNLCEKCVDDPSRIYDTSILISSGGEVLSKYRKTHLFDAFKFRESDFIKPGDGISHPASIGDFKIGFLICYDVRFPETARVLALKGCNLLCVSAAWFSGTLKEEHLLTMAKARAIENGLYVVLANQSPPTFCGRSAIIDPFGVVMADAGEMETMICADLSLERLKKVRSALPLLNQRRPELYGDLTTRF